MAPQLSLIHILDPSDEIQPAATGEQIAGRESVLDFTLPAQVREFFLLTAGVNVSTGAVSYTHLDVYKRQGASHVLL